MSFNGEESFDPFNMYIGILPTGAVSHVNIKLEHL